MAGGGFVIRAGRADGGAKFRHPGGWWVKVSSSGMANRMVRQSFVIRAGELDGEAKFRHPGWRTGWRTTSRHPRMVGPRAPGLECGGWSITIRAIGRGLALMITIKPVTDKG